MVWDDDLDEAGTGNMSRQIAITLERILAVNDDLGEIFDGFTRCLGQIYDISRGFLAVREGDQTRFLAVASWQQGHERRSLSLRLPTEGSLLDKVADDGLMYSDNFPEHCCGSMIERRLLLGDSARSFILRPLKHNAYVVGILGYSSDNPDAFAAFDEDLLDPFLDRFAERISRQSTRATQLR